MRAVTPVLRMDRIPPAPAARFFRSQARIVEPALILKFAERKTHSMSALLDASSLLLLRATSPINAAPMIIRHRTIAHTITTGFFILGLIMA